MNIQTTMERPETSTYTDYIHAKSFHLQQSPLIQLLHNSHQIDNVVRHIAPEMTFFMLGFRDLLGLLEFQNPEQDIEYQVNEQCRKDKDRWKVFLADLEKMGIGQEYWGTGVVDFFSAFWSDNSSDARNAVYTIASLISSHKKPLSRYTIIMAMHACYGVLARALVSRGDSVPRTAASFADLIDTVGGEAVADDDLADLASPGLLQHPEKFIPIQQQAIVDEVFSAFQRFFLSLYCHSIGL